MGVRGGGGEARREEGMELLGARGFARARVAGDEDKLGGRLEGGEYGAWGVLTGIVEVVRWVRGGGRGVGFATRGRAAGNWRSKEQGSRRADSIT